MTSAKQILWSTLLPRLTMLVSTQFVQLSRQNINNGTELDLRCLLMDIEGFRVVSIRRPWPWPSFIGERSVCCSTEKFTTT
jgi:hypothetical protein